MDHDVMGTNVGKLLAWKDKIEAMIEGADSNVRTASETLDKLLEFKSIFEATLPQINKTVMDVITLSGDIAVILEKLAPALEWIAERQKAEQDAKTKVEAEEQLKADAAARAQAEALGGRETHESQHHEDHQAPAAHVEHHETHAAAPADHSEPATAERSASEYGG